MTASRAAPVVLVVAKAPVAGEAKTRLAARVGDRGAAVLAAAALIDTLDACEEAFPQPARYLALTGDLERAEQRDELHHRLRTWQVVRQRGDGFARRLANAHADVARLARAPVVQIGMDTPHVGAERLRGVTDRLADGHDAVLGPATDGGWWVLAMADARHGSVLEDVPMSSDQTCARTEEALVGAGLAVVRAELLEDVDTAEDAERVSTLGQGRFAEAWRALAGGGDR